nr:hypothetical protein [Brucella intermedia]
MGNGLKILIAVACVLGSHSSQAQECVPASESQLRELRSALEEQLLDAQSARFKDVCIVQKHEGMKGDFAYCGSVNAKNKFGAYVGYKEFSYVDKASEATIVDKSSRSLTSNFLICSICTPTKNCSSLLNGK